MSKTLPWFPLDAFDWLNSKIILQNEADVAGVYIALMSIEWKEGALPKSIEDVLSFMPRKYTLESLQRTWAAVQHKYTLTPDGWVHSRLGVEKVRAENIRESRSEGGKRGAEKRWSNKDKNGSVNGSVKADLELNDGSLVHSNSYIDSNNDSTTKLQDPASAESSEPKKAKKEFYDWTHYEFDDEIWRRAVEEYIVPLRETGATMLLGAYLMCMKRIQDQEPMLASSEFQKLKTQAKHCIAFFTKKSDGSHIIGFQKAVAYVKWYVSQEEGSYIANSGWTLNLMLTTKTMNEFITAPTKKSKKNTQDKIRDVNNAAGYVTEENRLSAKSRRI